jgi:hypothetical protein
VFSKPIKIEGNLVYGENYEITLNPGWQIKTINQKGDMQIVEKM